jgi:P-type conjugative transfer protein TrbJ
MQNNILLIDKWKAYLSVFILSTLFLIKTTIPSQALDLVYDPWNYSQNLLTAARELQNIQNQVHQLSNEANMLANMDKNLLTMGSSISGDVAANLAKISALMSRAKGLAMRVAETETLHQRLFPKEYRQALVGNEGVRQAKERWEIIRASFGRSLELQAQVAENIEVDGGHLQDLMGKSQNARGALEVQQVGNELSSLNIKQALQLQSLMAAQYRAEALNKARSVATQEEARLRFDRFLGDGAAYSAQK